MLPVSLTGGTIALTAPGVHVLLTSPIALLSRVSKCRDWTHLTGINWKLTKLPISLTAGTTLGGILVWECHLAATQPRPRSFVSHFFTVCFLTVTTCTPVATPFELWISNRTLLFFFRSIPWPTSKHFALWSFRLVLPLHRDTIKLISYETFIILIIQNDLVPLLQVHVQGCNNIYCKCLEYKHSLPQNSSLYTILC